LSLSAIDILRGVESVSDAAGASARLTGAPGIAVAALGAAAGLAADIMDAMHDPVVTINVFRSILPAYLASKERVHDFIEQLAKAGT
jgi:hypothetical protein